MNANVKEQEQSEVEYLGEFTDTPTEVAEAPKSLLEKAAEALQLGGLTVLVTVAGFGMSYPIFTFVFAQQ